MSFFAKDNDRRLRELLRRAFPPDTPRSVFDSIADAYAAQRESSEDRPAHDARMNDRLRRVEIIGKDPTTTQEEMVDHLIDLHTEGKILDAKPHQAAPQG